MIILLGLLLLYLLALNYRSSLQTWAYGIGKGTRQLIGKPAPELPPLRALAGPPVKLLALRGKVVLLHFWTFD